MLCDFKNGVKVVTFSDLAPPRRERIGPPRPPKSAVDAQQIPFISSRLDNAYVAAPAGPGDEVVFAGSWHNLYPGDERIQLDYSRLLSFYDLSMASSLISARFNSPNGRLGHRLLGISDDDIALFRERLDEILKKDSELAPSSGVDWKTLLHVVTDRYADRLETLQFILNSTTEDTVPSLKAKAERAYSLLYVMVQPYVLLSAVNNSKEAIADDLSWAEPIYALCATAHTGTLRSSKALSSRYTESEWLILSAVDGVSKEVCRVVTKMWAEGFVLFREDNVSETVSMRDVVARWKAGVDVLMGWLDWSSVWLKCKPACGFEVSAPCETISMTFGL
jgi:hypothetical protein